MNTSIECVNVALFTRIVRRGEKDPTGEARYKGYHRVLAVCVDGVLEKVTFPEAQEDSLYPIRCVAIMDGNNRVMQAASLDVLQEK